MHAPRVVLIGIAALILLAPGSTLAQGTPPQPPAAREGPLGAPWSGLTGVPDLQRRVARLPALR